jgi:hypothetical protein
VCWQRRVPTSGYGFGSIPSYSGTRLDDHCYKCSACGLTCASLTQVPPQIFSLGRCSRAWLQKRHCLRWRHACCRPVIRSCSCIMPPVSPPPSAQCPGDQACESNAKVDRSPCLCAGQLAEQKQAQSPKAWPWWPGGGRVAGAPFC